MKRLQKKVKSIARILAFYREQSPRTVDAITTDTAGMSSTEEIKKVLAFYRDEAPRTVNLITMDIEELDRCPHGMFYGGAGACPQCGGGADA